MDTRELIVVTQTVLAPETTVRDLHAETWETVRRGHGPLLRSLIVVSGFLAAATHLASSVFENHARTVLVVGAVFTFFAMLRVSRSATALAGQCLGIRMERPTSPFRQYVSLAWLRLGLTLVLGAATALFLVPGLLLGARWSLALPSAVFESLPPRQALRRSWELTDGQIGRMTRAALLWAAIYAPLLALPDLLFPGSWATTTTAIRVVLIATVGMLATVHAVVFYRARVAETEGWVFDRPPALRPAASLFLRRPLLLAAASAAALVFGVALDYSVTKYYVTAGDLAWEQEQYVDALESYGRAANWNPEDTYIRYSLGWAYYALGEPGRASGHFQVAVNDSPEDPVLRTALAQAQIEVGHTAEALENLRKAREFAWPELVEEIQDLECSAMGIWQVEI